jgi:hypothetical protein
MLTMTDQLRSKNLVPFKKRRGPYHIFGSTGEDEELSLDQVDHDLSREEERFIRHYLGYADALLKHAPAEVPEPIEVSDSPEESSTQQAELAEGDKTSGEKLPGDKLPEEKLPLPEEKLPEDNGSHKAA